MKTRRQRSATFSPGRNIALKVPPAQWEATVRFYRDIVGLRPFRDRTAESPSFRFGSCRLWIDRVPGLSQAEIWLHLTTVNTARAARRLRRAGVTRCDEIESLPEGFDGFWISNPAGLVHLVSSSR